MKSMKRFNSDESFTIYILFLDLHIHPPTHTHTCIYLHLHNHFCCDAVTNIFRECWLLKHWLIHLHCCLLFRSHIWWRKKHFYCWATVYISRKWKRANLFGDSEANKQMFDLGFTAIMHMQLLSPSFANVLCETKHCLLTRRSASFCLCSAADTDLCNFILYVIKWHNKPNEYFKGQFLIHFKRCVPVV